MKYRQPKTPTEKEMVTLLKEKFSDDPDFLTGIMTFLETEDERQSMIDEIEAGHVSTREHVVMFAVQMDEEREE